MKLPNRLGLGAPAPDWCAHLDGKGYREMVEIVARQLGSRDMPGTPAEVWWPREAAEALGLPALSAGLARIPRRHWEAAIRRYYRPLVVRREAGDRVEAAAATLDLAVPYLRLALMREQSKPPGDVCFPGPLPGTIEVLALDAKVSDRYVSERRAAEWGAPLDQVRALAEAQVLALKIEEADRTQIGRPAVRSFSLEQDGPYIGPVIRHLAERLPDAMGPFGAYVGVPEPGGIVVRPLEAGMDLRGDLAEVALLTQAIWEKTATPIERVPFWVRPDGKIVPGPLQFDDRGAAGSSMPGLAGALAALDPREILPVAGWAQGTLSPEQYTRFAGCVSAELGHAAPEQVAMLGSGLGLSELARECSTLAFPEWPNAIGAHLRQETEVRAGARLLASGSAETVEATLDALVTWIAEPGADPEAQVEHAIGTTGFVEVLGVMAHVASPVTPSAAAAMGPLDELFARGRQSVRSSLTVTPARAMHVSGASVRVSGNPSPTAAIPHLMTWLPEAVGPYGALVAVGNAWWLEVLPITDASAVLDLPELLGAAVGASVTAEWPVPPAVFWLSPDRLDVLKVELSEGVVTGVTSSASLAGLVTRLPTNAQQLLPGLEGILDSEGAQRFYSFLRAAVVDRLETDAAGLAELNVPGMRELASRCVSLPIGEWPHEMRLWMDEMAAPKGELDRLTLATSYETVEPALALRVAPQGLSGSQLARDVGGGLTVYPVISVGHRHRRVTHAMAARWGVDAERCHRDAAARTAFAEDLIDEQMYADQPTVRQLYARESEREAAGLHLHLRYPETRRGFVVSITHGGRAHYIRLDDPGAPALIPAFSQVIAEIYRNADAVADAHSPWLFWLAPDGRLIELFDTTMPMPPLGRLPAELLAVASNQEASLGRHPPDTGWPGTDLRPS